MMWGLFKITLGDRFLGSGLGLIWAALSPLMLLGIFCFVFAFVFPGRLPGREGTLPFILWLISGYGPWLSMSEGLSSGTASVVSNSGLIKNISFKSELLPLVGTAIGIIPLLVSFVVLATIQAIGGVAPSPAVLVLPLVVILQLFFIGGLGFFLSALNVFVRDTSLILPSVLTILLFASPIFYPITSYPQALQGVLSFNPFYVLAECYRRPIISGTLPPIWMMAYMGVVAVTTFLAGLAWFRRLKPFFNARM